MVLLIFGGCASSRLDGPTQEPAEVEDRVIVDGEVLPLPEERTITTESLPAVQTMSPVAQALLVTADEQNRAGNADGAANSLERALRIEPRNALLWSRLADVRFSQGDFQQAIQLAAKSNTLVRDDLRLRRQNWYLMANAYESLGDSASAQKYRNKLSR